MNLIKISTDLELTVYEFPDGTYTQQNNMLLELIENHCNIYQCVKPKRLYTELHMSGRLTRTEGQSVCMLVDEEGLLKENKPNLIGSYLYDTDKHGNPIMGNILFVGEKWGEDGIDLCGIEANTFKLLKLGLDNMIHTMKTIKEGQGK